MDPAHSPVDLAKALVSDVRSLGLVSQSEVVLQDFSRRVLDSVRTIDAAVQVDEYSGHEFLDLISRLNQEVAPHLQQQAAPTAKPGPIHIWVIDQADKLSAGQQSIIFRLIELFPALPFRVIWLSKQPLQAWHDHANSESLLLDLDASPQPDAAGHMPEVTPDPLDGAVTESRDMSAPVSSDAVLHWPASGSSHKLKITAALVGAAFLGTLAWISTSTPSPSASEAGASAASAAAGASEAAPSAVPAVPAASSPAAAASETPAAVAAPATVTASAPQVSEAPQAAAAPKAAPAPHKALPEVARAGARWLKALPADTLVVEHGSFSSADQAQKLQAKYKELSLARIIAVRKAPNADEWQYSVVTGPFRSEDRAKSYVSRLDWRASTRIRGTDKLKPLLASAP